MKTKQPGLLDRVKQAVKSRPKRCKNWFDRLPEDAQRELAAIKEAWRRGEIESSARALANDIVSQCLSVGIKTCRPDGVRVWLSMD